MALIKIRATSLVFAASVANCNGLSLHDGRQRGQLGRRAVREAPDGARSHLGLPPRVCKDDMTQRSGAHILVVDDDPKVRLLLRRMFEGEGYRVSEAGSGREADSMTTAQLPDLITLDLGLPDSDGFDVARMIRSRSRIPIIMVTGKGETIDRVVGLELGADDYITKPFHLREVLARVRAVLRRSDTKVSDVLTFDDLTVDVLRSRVTRRGREIALSQKELQLLELLMRHADRVLSRNFIAERVWDIAFDTDSNVVDVYLWRLRAKIDEPFERKFIQTVRGRGYVFR